MAQFPTNFTTYVEKPIEVKATQWVGENAEELVASAEHVRDLLMNVHRSAHVQVIHEFQGSNRAWVQLHIGGWHKDKRNRMESGDWLVWSDRGFEILDDRDFIKKFKRKEKA